MNDEIKKQLKNWYSALDNQIGDTVEEIEKRRQQNIDAVKMRDDLRALIEYLDITDLPDPVRRAIKACLSWNPYSK